jgi:hypothetical protein
MAGHLSAIEGTNLSGLVLDMETTDKTISGLLFGAGAASSSTLITTATASKNFVQLYTKSTATSGDNRGIYNRFYLSGAGGGGESLRTFTTVNNVAAGTAHGAHISLSFGTTGSITGQGLGLRATLHVPNQAQSGGTYAGAQSEIYYDGASSNIAGSTVHSIHRFIQDGNATAYAKALNVFEFVNLSTGAGKMYASEMLRVIVNGSARYIPVSTAATTLTFATAALTTLGVTGVTTLGADAANGALLLGSGAASNATLNTTSTADKKFVNIYTESTATSGDSRLAYLRHYLGGAGGSGEALRAFTTVDVADVANAHGAHISTSFASGADITGQATGVRSTLHVPNAALSAGTYSAGISEVYHDGTSSSLAGTTTHAIHRFLAAGDGTGKATLVNVFSFEGLATDSSAGKPLHTGNTLTVAGGIRVIIDGVAQYIPYGAISTV